MCSFRVLSFLISFLVFATSGDCSRRAEEAKLAVETAEANELSLEADLESEEADESEEDAEADYEDYPPAEKGDTPDGGSESTGSTSADVEEDVEADVEEDDSEDTSSSDSVSAPPKIDFDKVHGMKKSAIWALIEEQESALKEFSGMIRGRWSKHKKQDRVIRRDWKAVTSKFDGLRAASKADQAEIDAMAGRIKAQKGEIRKLKSIVYKMR